MKVAYDISVLGLGHYHKRARTGVFRVVEKIAYGLLNSSDIDLTFYASQGDQYISMCQEYLKENKVFGNVNFASDIPDSVDILHSPFHAIRTKIPRVNKFLTVYDLIPIMYPQYFKFRESVVIKDAVTSLEDDSWVMCISHSTKHDLCNYINIDPARVFVSHLAADPLLFYPCKDPVKQQAVRQKHGIPEQPYLLSVSTLEPRKNIAHVIRCFIKVIREENLKDLNLVLVGTNGWDYDEIFKEIDLNSQYQNRIIVTEYVSDSDLAPLYSGALAFTYLSHYEGFGLPPLEAMQCGIPVITSNTSSLPEVVGDAGILIAPNDKDGFCQEILNLYQSSSLRSKYSCKSIEQAKKFSWDKCILDMLGAYRVAVASLAQSPKNEIRSLPDDFVLVIDGLYFQLIENNDPVKNFWENLLSSLVSNGFAQHIIVLDRGGSLPWHPGVNYQLFPAFEHKSIEDDCNLIQQFCNYVGADLFLSTFHTSPVRTPSIEVVYDFLPNLLDRGIMQSLLSLSSRLTVKPIGYLVFSEKMALEVNSLTSSNLGKQIYNLNCNLFASDRETCSAEFSSHFKSRLIEFTLPSIPRICNYLVFPDWKNLTENLYLELKKLLSLLALHPQRQNVSLCLVVEERYSESVNELLGGIVIELLMHDNLEIFVGEEVWFIEPLKKLQWQLFISKFHGWLRMQNSCFDQVTEDLMQNSNSILLDQWY
jgi:glycosyltransferase involved in cell wall biosynthesis